MPRKKVIDRVQHFITVRKMTQDEFDRLIKTLRGKRQITGVVLHMGKADGGLKIGFSCEDSAVIATMKEI